MNPTNVTPRIGILTISDRASSGEYEDKGGPAIRDWLTQAIKGSWEAVARVIPDDEALIETSLLGLCDIDACCLIITTGGTGPAFRDVTPDATEKVCSKMLPGFGELMRSVSLASVPTAILSRQTAGIRGRSLILNLPGKPAAIAECLHAVFPAVPYCIDLIGGAYIETHPDFCAAFRPSSALPPSNDENRARPVIF
ncbi:MAG: molybdopterin adenylyltransferase [Zoogloeaceae bacterium]|jgi:molybdopterin adenylyltransferase|nr:molybdopterin adenylyltransferase [Zoogloeaceae bacterium]